LLKRLIAAAALAACTLTVVPAHAEIQNLEIIAPANTGGDYDQHARALQQVLQDLIGAILTNKAPVTLDQVTPLARLTGEYQPLVVAANSPIKSLQDPIDKFKADPGSVSWDGFSIGSPDQILSALVIKAAGGDVSKMNYIASGAGGDLMAALLGNHITVGTGGYNEFAFQLEAGKLRTIGISAPERLPGLDIPTFKEQGVDVELVNWRAVFAKPDLKPADNWINLYQPADQFAAFLSEEQERVRTTLIELGLMK
jgi:putative tricarboxylic transport membrane protein